MPHSLSDPPYATVSAAISDLMQGKMVVVVDDLDRENEGDLIVAAEKVTKETINFMTQEGKGLICLSLAPEIQNRLALRPQAEQNTSFLGTNFTESINLSSLGMTGVTVAGRTQTILAAVSSGATADLFESPGYVFPLRAVPGGVLRRRGQTEASVDLARLAGLIPAGVICEIMDSDGQMIRGAALLDYCRKHQLKIISVQDVVDYRVQNELLLRRVAECVLDDVSGLASEFAKEQDVCSKESCDCGFLDEEVQLSGPFRVVVYLDDVDSKEHLCIIKGEPRNGALVRIHSECLTGDVFGSKRCDCGSQLKSALAAMCREGQGVVIYLYQEGRGIGLGNKLRAYRLQDEGFDTVEANIELGFAPDSRDYRAGAQILRDLNLTSVRLMTNNPRKVLALEGLGIKVLDRVPIISGCGDLNINYLSTKREKLGHLLPSDLSAHQPRLQQSELGPSAVLSAINSSKQSKE